MSFGLYFIRFRIKGFAGNVPSLREELAKTEQYVCFVTILALVEILIKHMTELAINADVCKLA